MTSVQPSIVATALNILLSLAMLSSMVFFAHSDNKGATITLHVLQRMNHLLVCSGLYLGLAWFFAPEDDEAFAPEDGEVLLEAVFLLNAGLFERCLRTPLATMASGEGRACGEMTLEPKRCGPLHAHVQYL